jgi:hypothetical protein
MAKAVKEALGDSPKFTTELQFSKSNQDAGNILSAVGDKLNELIRIFSGLKTRQHNLNEADAYKNFLSSLKPVLKLVQDLAQAQVSSNKEESNIFKAILTDSNTVKAFIETPGSVSIKNGIKQNLLSIITTGNKLPKVVTVVSNTITIADPNNEAFKKLGKLFKDAAKNIAIAKEEASKQNKLVQKTPKVPTAQRPRTIGGQFTSLASIQVLLNQALAKQIEANMGKGGEHKVLNYRTGRLAESAKVEKLSQSREGMITAFYTYMKYPYATFSTGGRQENPRTRDPKLLISTSIREISAKIVGNRMRAVLI